MPIASGKTIEMMARYGFKAMVTLNGEKILDDVVRAYHAACQKHGRPKQLGEDVIWGAGVYLADSKAEAMRRLEPAHDERFKWFAPFGFVRYADEHGRTWGSPGAPDQRPDAGRRRQAEGLVLRHPPRGDRRHQVDRGEVPRPRALHDPLGRGARPQGIQGAAALVRQGRDAGIQALRLVLGFHRNPDKSNTGDLRWRRRAIWFRRIVRSRIRTSLPPTPSWRARRSPNTARAISFATPPRKPTRPASSSAS